MLFPIASGQLLYTFVFDRDCFPSEYGSFIMGYSKEYVQARPVGYPDHLQWPGTYDIVDSIGKIAGLNYPYALFCPPVTHDKPLTLYP